MANSVDPDQTAPRGAVWSGSTLFAPTCVSENLYLTLYSVSSHIEVAKQVQSSGLDNLFRSSSLSRII